MKICNWSHHVDNMPMWLRGTKEKGTASEPRFGPFSRSFDQDQLERLRTHLNAVVNTLPFGRETDNLGLTEDDIRSVKALLTKINVRYADDIALRKHQDVVLQCLHPDGRFTQHLSDDVKRKAFAIGGTDPIKGVYGLPFGYPNETIFRVSEYLLPEIEKLKEKNYDWDD